MGGKIIEIKSLTKQFGELKAVNNLDLEVDKGQMFGIVGPDGAGKTTTMRLLCGILTADSGEGRILGHDFKKEHKYIKRKIGYLSQKFSLYGDLTVSENIDFFAQINDVKKYKNRKLELLEFMRLDPFQKRMADKLSGGMKQKLALACTLIHKPEILFLDEPTTGVDPVSRRDFWKILFDLLKEGITIILTTPYLDEAERCMKVGLMNKGKFLAVDTVKEIKKLMKGHIIEIVSTEIRRANKILGDLPYVRETQTFGDRLNTVIESEESIKMVEEALKNNSIEIKGIREILPSLENVFISLIK